jgi:holo-[acyl-carrier protein] synthase
MLNRHGDRFLTRCFTKAERDYAGQHKRRAEHLAARFAAKEAVMKALGTGLQHGIAWTDIAVDRSASGAPFITLTGEAASTAARLGLRRWALSLSHTGTMAIASVVATG